MLEVARTALDDVQEYSRRVELRSAEMEVRAYRAEGMVEALKQSGAQLPRELEPQPTITVGANKRNKLCSLRISPVPWATSPPTVRAESPTVIGSCHRVCGRSQSTAGLNPQRSALSSTWLREPPLQHRASTCSIGG
eukprot:scaffold1518_cov417-Prasinococcus_capsulatus_cf.AAC.34